MPTIVIQHPVADYTMWRKQFDADPLGRAKSGVTGHSIYRTNDGVLVLLEFASMQQAEAYLPRLEALWKGVRERLGLGQAPRAEIIESIESLEY